MLKNGETRSAGRKEGWVKEPGSLEILGAGAILGPDRQWARE